MAASLAGLPAFILYFALALAFTAAYLAIYVRVTFHDEIALIRANVVAAALSLGLSLVGFAIPLASAVVNARTLVDLAVWGAVALVVQIAIYFLVRFVLPDLSARIAANETAAALTLGCASVAAGLINASCMTY